MIVTGDPSQTDLPDGTESGLIDAAKRLARTEGVAFVGFEKSDVVRHDLVKRVIAAYEADERGDRGTRKKRPSQTVRERGDVANQPDNAGSDVGDGSMGMVDMEGA